MLFNSVIDHDGRKSTHPNQLAQSESMMSQNPKHVGSDPESEFSDNDCRHHWDAINKLIESHVNLVQVVRD